MNKQSNETTRNPEEIRAEITHHKHEIAKTISEATDSLKADEVLDAGVDYVVQKSEQAYSSTKQFVKENPVPVTLASVGIASLIAAGLHMRSRRRNPQGYNNLTSKAQAAGRAGSEKLTEAQSSIKHTAHQAHNAVVNKTQEVSSSVHQFAQDKPVLTACIGAAVGAAIGGLLPRTRFEDETIGPVRDESFNQIQHSAEKLVADAKEAVTHSLEGHSSAINEYETADYQPKRQSSL